MRTIEEIQAAMQVIVDAAADRSFTDTEVTQYEALESELQQVQRDNQIRSRNAAYNVVRYPAGVPTGRGNGPDGPTDLDRAFTNYLRTGRPNADISQLAVRNAQSEGSSAGGGYTVPPGFRQKLVEVMVAFGGLAAEVDGFNTATGNSVDYPSLDDTANQGTITAESAAFSSGADLTFGTVPLGAYKYTASGANNLPLRVPVELIQDSAFDIDSLVARAFGTRIARKQSAHWVLGTGAGEPQGIASTNEYRNTTLDNDLDVADVIDYDDIMDTYDLLDPAYEGNAIWVMRKNTWSQIRGIVDTTGRPLVQASTEGISGQPTKNLLGYRVVIDQCMPLLSAAAITNPIAFGDFKEAYVIRRVQDLTIVVNPWTRAANGEVEYVGWERADGNVQNRAAYVLCRNNT